MGVSKFNSEGYSHHATDPVSGKLLNAFDLVRLHRFQDQDEKVAPDTPPTKLPSYKAMCDLAVNDARVKEVLAEERQAQAQEDFDDEDWEKSLELERNGEIKDTLSNICAILKHDPNLKAIVFNQFKNMLDVVGELPWRQVKPGWSETDLACAKLYFEQHYEFLLAAFKNMATHMAEGGSAYIFHADTEGLNFRRAFKEAGFHISGVCIWEKNSLVLGRSPYQWQHEPVLFGWLPNGKHKWFSDHKQSTIWKFDKPKRSKEHPTMKPVPLLAYPIKNSSAPNAVVMDLFGGSGSTLIACEQTDRICRTMELDPRYASVIVERYVNFVGALDGVSVLRDGQELKYENAVSIQ